MKTRYTVGLFVWKELKTFRTSEVGCISFKNWVSESSVHRKKFFSEFRVHFWNSVDTRYEYLGVQKEMSAYYFRGQAILLRGKLKSISQASYEVFEVLKS